VIDTTYKSVHTSEKTNSSLFTKDKQLKTVRKMVAFYSENGMTCTNTRCGQKAEYLNPVTDGIYSKSSAGCC
jgi:hypothetical protein